MSTQSIVAAEPRDCPYVGLDFYREKSGAWFFGREADADKVITNLLAARLTLLHAESGVGKSSLLRAGVAWRLRQLARGEQPPSGVVDLPVVFSEWKDDPVEELIGEIEKATRSFMAERPMHDLARDHLDSAIEAAANAADANLLIILDQFEEYFLYRSSEPTPERFADELSRCVNQTSTPANFLIAIREDAYAGLGDLFKGRIANIYGNYLHIEYLDRESAEHAIRAPLDVYNRQPQVTEPVTIQDVLVNAVLDQVRAYDANRDTGQNLTAADGDGERFATPLLQLAMETVWKIERDQGSHELRLSTLQALEGVGKIVDTHVWRALRELSSSERQIAIDLFDHLVTPSGGKIAESVPDLAHRTGRGEDQVANVLAKLDPPRIVRPVPAPPGYDSIRFRRYEIFHDVLAPPINRIIAAREGRRRARQLRRLAGLIGGLLVISVLVGGVFLYLWRNAVNQQHIAESRQLAQAANTELAADPDMSALLARKALRIHDTSAAEAALRATLPEIQEIRKFQAPSAVFGAAFDPANENEVVSAGQDGKAWIWDVNTRRHLVGLSPQDGPGSHGYADAVAFNPAGSQIAVGYSDGSVIVFSPSGAPLRTISADSGVNDIRFVGNTGDLAIATFQNAVLWTPHDGSRARHLLYSGQVNAIAVNPDNEFEIAIATNSGARFIALSRDLNPAHPGGLGLSGPNGLQSNDVTFSGDGKDLAAAGADGVVRVYNVATAKQVKSFESVHGDAVSVAFGLGSKLILVGDVSGIATIWDTASNVPLTQLTGNEASLEKAQFNADGQKILTASLDGTIRIWDVQPRDLNTTFFTSKYGGAPNPEYSAEYNPEGTQILAVDGSESAYVFTTVGTQDFSITSPYVNAAHFNREGSEIVTADADGTVELWGDDGGSQVFPASPIKVKGPALNAFFSPDSSRVVVLTNEGTAVVFDSLSGHRLYVLSPDNSYLRTAVFSPNGSQLLTGDGDGRVEVWDATNGHELRVLGKQGAGINDLEFDRTGKYFATTSFSGVVTIWSASGRYSSSFTTCASPNTASLSPGGGKVVVACSDGSVPVFTSTGQELAVFSDPGIVNSAAFSPDGKSIVTTFGGNRTGGVWVWSSELANPSLKALETMAAQRIIGSLSRAQINSALAGNTGWAGAS